MRKISKIMTALAISWIGLSSFSFAAEHTKPIAFSVNAPVRDYNIPLSTQSQNDITYIVTMLGNSSLLKIMKNQSTIKKAGERLETVHPFHFI